MMRQRDLMTIANSLFSLSVIAAGIAALVFFLRGEEIFGLAGTQWLLVSIVLGVFSANMRLCKECCGAKSLS